MLVGGALGNILDRLRSGSVTDFVKLPLGWPPFNLADASITIGVILLLYLSEASSRSSPPARS
jgi:signal peptidase II